MFRSFSSSQNHIFVLSTLLIVDLGEWRGENVTRIYGARRAPRAPPALPPLPPLLSLNKARQQPARFFPPSTLSPSKKSKSLDSGRQEDYNLIQKMQRKSGALEYMPPIVREREREKELDDDDVVVQLKKKTLPRPPLQTARPLFLFFCTRRVPSFYSDGNLHMLGNKKQRKPL